MANLSFDSRPPVWLMVAAFAAAAPAAGATSAPQTAVAAPTARGDVIIGGSGPETLQGLGGDDSVRGMGGDDVVNGNAGDDSVGGGPGADLVHGGQGRDRLNGGQGDDTLSGDRDNDTLTGGLGADRFVFDNLSGSDVVTDFDSAGGDRIELPTGFPYTVADGPQGAVITLTGYGTLQLLGVPMARMGTWLVEAPKIATPSLPVLPNPPKPPSRLLLAAIVLLAIAFVGLLSVGLIQLVRGGKRRR